MSDENITVEEAAKILGQSVAVVRNALIQGRAPYGYAVLMNENRRYGKRWRYCIVPKRLYAYVNALDMNYRAEVTR